MNLLFDMFGDRLPDRGDAPVILKGNPHQFEGILSWNDLSHLLKHKCFLGSGSRQIWQDLSLPSGLSRVCILKEGKKIERLPSDCSTQTLIDLLPGNTLRVEALEEIHEPISTLARSISKYYQTVYINAYASNGTKQGLNIHYDYTNVIVLQLEGKKLWKIYRPTEFYERGPKSSEYKTALQLAKENEEEIAQELEKVYKGLYWQGELHKGDALFIPPGWLHDVYPVGEATLHLACAYDTPVKPAECKDNSQQLTLPDILIK